MRRYLTRRLLLAALTLLLASLVVFAVLRVLPGDPSSALLAGEGEALDPAYAAALRAELGLDAPLAQQYLGWLARLASRELGGVSLATREPVGAIVARTLPVTLLLGSYALGLATLLGVPLGALAAHRAGGWPDRLLAVLVVLGALPGFWLALLALLAVVALLGWSPPLVYAHPWQRPLEHLGIMALPAAVLALELAAHLGRVARAGTLEALAADHVRQARAKGLAPARVLGRHALRTAAIPIATVLALQVTGLLGGAVILEAVFGLPGLGRGLVQAVVARDYVSVQGIAMVLVALALALQLLVDLAYAALDPRVRLDA